MRPDIFLATIGRGSNGSNALEVTEDRAAVTAESQDNIINRVNNLSQYGPSWHYVPGIGVAGTAYAEVPGSALGDLAFTRASSKTRTNAAGVVETIGNNVPPHDYRNADGSLSTFPRLNLEPQRTNLLRYSEQFNNTWWTGSGSIVANTAVSPSGYQDADTGGNVYPSAGVGDCRIVNTASIFAKANPSGASTLALGMNRYGFGDFITCTFNLATGTAGTVTTGGTASGASARIEDYGNGWYRCSITGTPSTSVGTLSFNPQNTCFIWGAQLEAGSYATSYIPTTTAAVTRLVDAASKTGVSSLIGQTEGTLFCEVNVRNAINGTTRRFIAIGDGTSNNRIGLGINTNNVMEGFVVAAGGIQALITSATVAVQSYKIALAYKGNDIAFYMNGAQIGTDNLATIPAVANLYLMHEFGQDLPAANGISQAALFPKRLTNAQLAQLTTL